MDQQRQGWLTRLILPQIVTALAAGAAQSNEVSWLRQRGNPQATPKTGGAFDWELCVHNRDTAYEASGNRYNEGTECP